MQSDSNTSVIKTLSDIREAIGLSGDAIKLTDLVDHCRTLKQEHDRYKQAIEDCLNYANGRQSEWGSRAEESFELLENALYPVTEEVVEINQEQWDGIVVKRNSPMR